LGLQKFDKRDRTQTVAVAIEIIVPMARCKRRTARLIKQWHVDLKVTTAK
jgi:hypothetical protein